MKVKICGITREEDLKVACSLGVDMVGFVVEVSSSARSLTLKRAQKLFKLVPSHVKSVLVTVPESLSQLLGVYRVLRPDAIQIHGEGIVDFKPLRERLPRTPLIRALTVRPNVNLSELVEREGGFFNAFLADSHSPERHGGTGCVHDWRISRWLRDFVYPKPLILAGGLNPSNVGEAIRIVKPWAVDVSSGVESKPGVKSPEAMSMFVKRAKEEGLEVSSAPSPLWWLR
ncbi:MAG: phosphoribosylanthranilate isomerase [Candidatus Nezhaarchaeota archaeon]|nr:phosphoribosylanthranilate isomerase [Candidatus Nezhaarchaeota archaeon]